MHLGNLDLSDLSVGIPNLDAYRGRLTSLPGVRVIHALSYHEDAETSSTRMMIRANIFTIIQFSSFAFFVLDLNELYLTGFYPNF